MALSSSAVVQDNADPVEPDQSVVPPEVPAIEPATQLEAPLSTEAQDDEIARVALIQREQLDAQAASVTAPRAVPSHRMVPQGPLPFNPVNPTAPEVAINDIHGDVSRLEGRDFVGKRSQS